MFVRLPKSFRFELQEAQRDRLRRSYKPRLEWLEDRLAPSVFIFSPGDQTSNEGASNSFALGNFFDNNPAANSWRVDVNWGDASAHTAFNLNTQGSIPNAPHTYGEEGNFTATITVTNNANESNSATFNVSVFDVAVVGVPVNFGAATNNAFSNQVVATFTDPGGSEPNASDPSGAIANHYSATIDWGDNSFQQTTGAITLSNGVYSVRGGHTYTQSGTYTTTVIISHESAPQTTVNGTATVGAAAII